LRWRRFRLGLNTLLRGRGGIFIPHRYAHALPGPGARDVYGAVERLFLDGRARFAEHLAEIDRLAPALAAIATDPPAAPRWGQDWFPRLDAAAAYAMVRRHRPARILEIGSGHSTRFLARAVTDGGLATRIAAVDPAPRADIAGLGVEVVPALVQDAPPALFEALASGDFLMIDSSHVLMPGSDVDLLVNHVLPRLPVGVFVHFHDVFLPDDYPAAWAWRAYNEQLALPALLLGGFETLFASHFVVTRMAAEFAASAAATLPLPKGAYESSLWLRKTASAPDLAEGTEKRQAGGTKK